MKEKLFNFSGTIYGDLKPYNEVLSLARCRIFYKGANRNGTYITDEFAEKLLSSIPYVPVKGIYDYVEGDYTDHGRERYEGRIYGVVSADPNLKWEEHKDEDGITRLYACVDVLLFTGLYKEAKEIVGKSQSMELYAKSIDGEFRFINGKRYFVYTEGCFLGLQALGEETEPCFEGAAFYNLQNSFEEFFNQIDEYKLESQKEKNGGKRMIKINFKLSDGEKLDMLWELLNPNFNEEGGYEIDYFIYNVYDEYAVVRNLEEQQYERVYYTKDDTTDSVLIDKKETCYIVDVNETEKEVLDNMVSVNGSFEKTQENYEKLENENSEFSIKIEDQEATISTLKEEKEKVSKDYEEVKANYTNALSDIEKLEAEKKELNDYKYSIERAEKENIINQYVEKIDQETLDSFSEKIDEFTKEQLEKELAYTLVLSKPEIFSYEGFYPKESHKDGIEEILSRY